MCFLIYFALCIVLCVGSKLVLSSKAGREFLPPFSMETPNIAYPLHFLFIQILSIPPSPNHYSLCLFIALFLWLNGCICHIWCTILLNDIMDLHMFSLGTLISEGVCCVFYTTRHQIYWGLTNNKCFCWYSDLMSHKKSRAHKHRGQETNSPNKYILRSPVMCSQQLSLFH